MADIAVLSKRTFRPAAQTVVWLFLGLGLLAGSAAALYFSGGNDLQAAYDSAPTCATFADAEAGKNCRYTATATVTNVVMGSGGVEVYFQVPGSYFPRFSATLRDTSLRDGDQVQVEFWQLKVTRMAGAITVDNPANYTLPGVLRAIGLLLLPLGVCAAAWGVVKMRKIGGRGGPAPGMGPVAMSDVLWR